MYNRICAKCSGEKLIKKKPITGQLCKSCATSGKNNAMYGKENKWGKHKKLSIEKMKRNRPDISGENNPMYGKTHKEKSKQKIRESRIGKYCGKNSPLYGIKRSKSSIEKRLLAMPSMKGKNNPMYGKHHSNETKKKLRILKLKRLEEINGYVYPGYNPTACDIIDDYGQKHGYNFQHALNGGEFHIKELGYFVDGYDGEKNVVVEYYEKAHKHKKERDNRRKQEIVELLDCKFIELNELEEKWK